MRRLILISLFLFLTANSFGQNNLDNQVSSNVCNCLEKTKNLTQENLILCLQEAMEKNKDEIIKECLRLYNDTSYQAGYKFGQELYGRISVSMIYTCISYFELMDSVRFSALENLNKDSVKALISEMSKSDTVTWNTDSFTQRGVLYFQIGDLDNALKDFNNVIKQDQHALQSIYFKAWTLELLKNYDEAYTLYSNLAIMTKKNEFNIFAAIAKQKKNKQSH